MKDRSLFIAAILGLALSMTTEAQEEVKIRGRVVDVAGKPVNGADLATYWIVAEGRMNPYRDGLFHSTTTNAEGRFALAVATFPGRKQALMAIDKDRKRGGLIRLDEKSADKPAEIKLVPLVRVHGRAFCQELKKTPPWLNIDIKYDSALVLRFLSHGSEDASFSFSLPSDSYQLDAYTEPEYQKVTKEIRLPADKSDLNLKTLDILPSFLTRYIGKHLPAWHVADARGLKKDVKLSDFKGKWVLLEFWGWWCGPCVSGSLPNLIDLYEDHDKDRDRFEIIAFHNSSAKDLAEVDKKVEQARQRFWDGRDLPFPVLLDASGQTVNDWGIQVFPTALLIDPEGRLVGRVVGREALEAKLPPLPLALRVTRGLDRGVTVFFDDPTLEQAVQQLTRKTGLPIRLDIANLKQQGIARDMRVLLYLSSRISLRSCLDLILGAYDLTCEQDENGFVIRCGSAGTTPSKQLSERQRAAVQRIEKALDRNVSFELKDKPLAEASAFFVRLTRESFVLDPRDRMAGRLDSKTPVSGSAKEVPLREALKKLLEPIGVSYTIRDEVIVFTAKPKTGQRK
ncbi:MAG TPA: redoxin domain-containing protein [Gemmataceae bacterium]